MADQKTVEVLHGVNLNMLGKRDPTIYGEFTLTELQKQVDGFAAGCGLEVRHFQSNFEGEFVERLHELRDVRDGLVINAGAWTHYSWAIRDAIEIAALPSVEVHISDIYAREEWRAHSTISDVCIETITGKGPDGYRLALELLAEKLR